MGNYCNSTKPWLRSVIRQRRLLIRINKSHKNRAREEMAIERLESQLNAYSYDNDLYLARFIIKYVIDIDTIIPGKGSSCYEKKQNEWREIIKHALILSGQPYSKQGSIPTNNKYSTKTEQYEATLF